MTKKSLVLSIFYGAFVPLCFGLLLICASLYAYLLELRFGVEASLLPVVLCVVAVGLYTWYLVRVAKAMVEQYKEKVSNK